MILSTLFGVCELHGLQSSSNVDIFQHCFSKYCFLQILSFLFFGNSSRTHLSSADSAPQATDALPLCSAFLVLCTVFWVISIAVSWSSPMSSSASLLFVSVCFASKVLVQSVSYLSLMLVFLMNVYNLFISVISMSLFANLTSFYWLIFLLATITFSCCFACLVIFIRCWTLKRFYIVGCWILPHHFKYSWGFVLEMQLRYPESVGAGV